MAWTIQRLTAHDVPLMRQLNTLFATAFADPESYASAPPTDGYLADLLGRDQFFALAAVSGDAVIGGLVAYELPKFEQARSEMYIYDLAVEVAHRREGVATTLIGALVEVARRRGCWALYVQADYGDEPAVALYTKLGVREDVMHFDINLGDDSRQGQMPGR